MIRATFNFLPGHINEATNGLNSIRRDICPDINVELNYNSSQFWEEME